MEVKIKKPYVSRNLVKYEGLEVKNERRRLNIKFTRNLGMKVKSILNSKIQLNGTLYILIKDVDRRPQEFCSIGLFIF